MTTPYVSDLIHIRNYVMQATNNYNLPKTTAKELNRMMTVLDKKIVQEILSDEFKAIVGFEDVDAIMKEAAINNNIKSGMKSTNTATIPVVSVSGGKAHTIKPEPV